jgi:hypothetical protein
MPNALLNCVDQCEKRGLVRVVIDYQGVINLDESIVICAIASLKKLRAAGGDMRMVHKMEKPVIYGSIDTSLGLFSRIHDTLEEALEAMRDE